MKAQSFNQEGFVSYLHHDGQWAHVTTQTGESVFLHSKQILITNGLTLQKGTTIQFDVVPAKEAGKRSMCVNASLIADPEPEPEPAWEKARVLFWSPRGFGKVETESGEVAFLHARTLPIEYQDHGLPRDAELYVACSINERGLSVEQVKF